MERYLTENSIKYLGNSNVELRKTSTFKIFLLSKLIKLPNVNCTINDILQINCDISTLTSSLVKTPKGSSCDGSIFTGYKIFFKGIARGHIQYTCSELANNIRHYDFNILFVQSLTLLDYDYLEYNTTISPYIIDIIASKFDYNSIYITLTAIATLYC